MSPEQNTDLNDENSKDFLYSIYELSQNRPEIWGLIGHHLSELKDDKVAYDHFKSVICFDDSEFNTDNFQNETEAIEHGESAKFELRLHRSSTFSVIRMYDYTKNIWNIAKLTIKRDWPATYTPEERLEETRRLLSELRLAYPEAFSGFLLEDQPHIAELLGKIATTAER